MSLEPNLALPHVGVCIPLLQENRSQVSVPALVGKITEGLKQQGLQGQEIGVPSVSGHDALGIPCRNALANAIEMAASTLGVDALVGLQLCDQSGPGIAMALARLNYPGMIVGGGAHQESISSSFNTWGMALETLGLMPLDSASLPSKDTAKQREIGRISATIKNLLQQNIRPRDLLTRPAFVNATTVLATMGASTDGVLHLLALAREARVSFNLLDIQAICRTTPLLCNFAPRGRGAMRDLHLYGGTSMLLKHLWIAGMLDDSCLTISGRTLADMLFEAPELPPHQDLIADYATPFQPYAEMQVCFGNVAPDGIIFKLCPGKAAEFSGAAVCFQDVRALEKAAAAGEIVPGTVIVLRGLGPVGGGMPEVKLQLPALSQRQFDGRVALISDARVRCDIPGVVGVHCAPESALSGPLGLVKDGETISIDPLQGKISWEVTPEELHRRQASGPTTAVRLGRGYLADFASTTSQADCGCVSRNVL